ncbi:MAG: HDOD domain-containing protein [Planctomycetes bacterium]|nr:HDOD domain-containing protein [Planctomycetota bacterium]
MDLKQLTSEIKELPTLPQVAVTLMELLDDPGSSAPEINRVMARDPALASKILKLVNSAYYGLANKVSSLNQAIVILGFKTVKSVALSASVMGLFKGPKGTSLFDRGQFWKHSIACACVARLVARKQGGLDPDMSFSVGLLHDIGKQVLEHYLPSQTDEIITLAREKKCSFLDAEAQVLETNHAEIGSWLAETWGLPRDLTAGIGYHHDIVNAPNQELVAVIQFADYLSKVKGIGAPGSCESPELSKDVWGLLTVDKSDLPELVNTINQEIEAASAWLEVTN